MKNNLMQWCYLFLLGFNFFAPANAQNIYQEEDGLLIVEMTSLPSIGEWKQGSTTLKGKTIQYLYSETEYFQDPGNQLLTYKIRITNPGTYKFVWHSKVGEGSSPTDYNDSWLRVPDAGDFYAQNVNGQVLHPKGICEDDCPNGMGAAGWFKVYSNGTTDWTWRAKTSDNDPHEIYARFEEAGTYTVQLSARSSYHFLNRFMMYQPDRYTEVEVTDLALPPSEWVLEKQGPLEFGLREIETALAGNDNSTVTNEAISWEILPESADLKPEGFILQKLDKEVVIQGADEAGLMYGCLELSEQIRLFGLENIRETRQNPYMELRGTKFNIPLDMRTPSYTDASDAAQQNIATIWDMDFWTAYIDNLPRYRFNYISLGNLHPFPSMVKVPDYPEVGLDDVLRSTTQWQVTVQNIRTISFMGKYYAHKIAGSTDLALFRENGEQSIQDKTVAELEVALKYWKIYKYAALKQNKHPLWTNRVGYVDFEKTT